MDAACVRDDGCMRPRPSRISTQVVGRRGVLLALPAALAPLLADGIGGAFQAPFVDAATNLRARAGAIGGDLQYATRTGSKEQFGRAVLAEVDDADEVVSVSVLDRRTGARWHHRGETPFPLASSAKVLVVAAAMVRARARGDGLSAAQRAQAEAAITKSDNAAADALFAFGGRHEGLVDVAAALGMGATVTAARDSHWGATRSTTDDQVTMMRAFALGSGPLYPDDNAALLRLMGEVVDGQRWGVGTVGGGTVRVRVKNGWMTLDATPGRPWQVNSVGDVRGGGRDYVLALAQRAQETQYEGFERASRIGRTVYAALAEPLR